MKEKGVYFIFTLFVFLLTTCMVFVGCSGNMPAIGESKLSDSEQFVYDYAIKHGSNSSKVELEKVLVFNADSYADENLKGYEKFVDNGQHVLLLAHILWDNGAKDDIVYEYFTDKDGNSTETDWTMIETNSSGSDLNSKFNKMRSIDLDAEIEYYAYLVGNKKNLSYEDFMNGKLGYLDINEESMQNINEELSKEK